jgi:hypothetical protein
LDGAFYAAEHALLTAAHTLRFGRRQTKSVLFPLAQNRELVLSGELRMADNIPRLREKSPRVAHYLIEVGFTDFPVISQPSTHRECYRHCRKRTALSSGAATCPTTWPLGVRPLKEIYQSRKPPLNQLEAISADLPPQLHLAQLIAKPG